MMKHLEVAGKSYPIIDYACPNDESPYVPVLDMGWMSDIKYQRMSLKDRLKRPHEYAGEDVPATVAHLEGWLSTHDPDYEQWRKTLIVS